MQSTVDSVDFTVAVFVLKTATVEFKEAAVVSFTAAFAVLTLASVIFVVG